MPTLRKGAARVGADGVSFDSGAKEYSEIAGQDKFPGVSPMPSEPAHPATSTGASAASALTHQAARAKALAAGFTEAGLVAIPYAAEERDAGRFAAWVRAGRAGTMQYLERTSEDGQLTRERVRNPFPWARSALVCFASYLYPSEPLSTETQERGSAWIARYAWTSRLLPSRGDAKAERRPSDYHKVLLKRLRAIDSELHAQFGEFESRAYVDTGPVVERALAVAAGLGWTGKNTCLIHPQLGSWGFLAVLLTSLEVSESAGQPVGKSAGRQASTRNPFEIPDRCGTCRRCIEACPTNALDVPYQMDAARCIAYLTIEHKGPIAEELLPGIGRQVFGCDICQDVCPWNKKTARTPIAVDPGLEPRPELVNPALDWLSSLDEQGFERLFNGSPVRRTGFFGLRRNVAIAMGNSGLARFAPQLETWASAEDVGLRAAALWGLARLRKSSSE
jgi:epoxyqueuosine reductase